MLKKECSNCKTNKDLSDFYYSLTHKNHVSQCKVCYRKKSCEKNLNKFKICKQCKLKLKNTNFLKNRNTYKLICFECNKSNINNNEKFCSKCKTKKSLNEFRFKKWGYLKKHSQCKLCEAIYKKGRNCYKERAKTKIARFKRQYNITEKIFIDKINELNQKCEICNVYYSELHVDHCHKNNKFRSLLCPFCNRGLGNFQDNLELIEKGLLYLIEYEDLKRKIKVKEKQYTYKSKEYKKNIKLKSHYNINLEQYYEILKYCNNKCGICGSKDKRLVIDHYHEVGYIRGILCDNCNLGIGNFCDSFKVFQGAINYLKKYNNKFLQEK